LVGAHSIRKEVDNLAAQHHSALCGAASVNLGVSSDMRLIAASNLAPMGLAKSGALKMWLGVDMPNDCRVVAFTKLETVDTGSPFYLNWSGRRESNPRMQLGKLPFCH
jgi:hypothetical protein